MKATLVAKLIEAHCSGQEAKFEQALMELANDEEKKGNVSVAQSIRNAYRPSKNSQTVGGTQDHTIAPSGLKSSGFTIQGGQFNSVPRDRESLFELYDLVNPAVRLEDIILPEKQKEILTQILGEQKNAEVLLRKGLTPVNRVLLCGPPGCGKTMTAMAMAQALGISMAYVRLDGLVSSYLGQTSTNLRKVFDSVKNQRVVLFLDEFDAIAKKRDDAHELGELKRVVTTLLQNFDNMPNNVFLIAATNHHHLLDPAIWRRFNVVIMLELPDLLQRKRLFTKWLSDYPVAKQFDYALVSKVAEGLNGSQIQEIVRATAKYVLVNYPGEVIETEHLLDTLIRQVTLYSKENNEEFWSYIRQLNKKGVSLRVLERALGVPKSTIRDRIKEGDLDG
ncbi:AAA ATPase, central domain protein [Desulforamulus reducens MI-1]|uniref:AAA ATPase, central domain protein n=1 Tax=Desulforamulus reducens (strain ATCC BAA-1160 / DSM 100696 / MI-1) TaxID=349161 RepID=A4J1W4_DESRM|nr:ATP-binding protein [Desulforamulus reducens]ABO49067.1 AAA ATPase, central domain protein [Desulforamulus reducens MI-1]